MTWGAFLLAVALAATSYMMLNHYVTSTDTMAMAIKFTVPMVLVALALLVLLFGIFG